MRSSIKTNDREAKARINTVIVGEPAVWLDEWKRRGIVISNTDAVVQAFITFNEKVTEQDLKIVQLRNLRRVNSASSDQEGFRESF